MTDHRKFRASDQDRDKAAEMLRVAAGEGRINLEELTERIDRTYAARTLGELDEVVSDLPRYGAPPPAATPTGPRSPAPAEGDVLRLHTGSGRITRTGRWTVPRHMSARVGRWGRLRIDFTLADCPHREVLLDIEITSWFGDIVVVVPHGWWVHDEE